MFSSEFRFSKLRVRDEDNNSLFGLGLVFAVVVDNGGGKRKEDVPLELKPFEIDFCCLIRDVLGDIGGFRSVA